MYVDSFLYLDFNFLPRVNPKYVNNALMIENIVLEINIYSLFKPKAIPTVNESKLTLKAINRIVKLFKILVFSSSFDLYISIESITNNIKVNMFILGILYLKAYPIKYPRRGIIKWNNPTISAVFSIIFFLGEVVPKERDKLKASILSPIPVKKYIRDI